jgi:hypothetical protein
MRCRRAIEASAVVLYTGWLLMLPPWDGHGGANTNAPLNRWEHHESFDTAKDCQEGLTSNWDLASRVYGQDGKTTKRYRVARCVPSEAVCTPPAKEP